MMEFFILILLFAIWFSLQSLHGIVTASRLKIREDIREQSKVYDKAFNEISDVLERLSIILIYHDATVRGTNPKTLGSSQELLDTLRKQRNPKND